MHGGCGYDHRTIAYPIWALRTLYVARVAALIPLVPSSLSMVASCGCQLWLAGMCELQSRRKNSRHVHEDYINRSEIASIVESCPGPPSYCKLVNVPILSKGLWSPCSSDFDLNVESNVTVTSTRKGALYTHRSSTTNEAPPPVSNFT
jgi:hypothetical protein